MLKLLKPLFAFFIATLLSTTTAHATVKIKDIVDVEGVRGNDLVGYGLVIGLDGSGDTIRNSPLHRRSTLKPTRKIGRKYSRK